MVSILQKRKVRTREMELLVSLKVEVIIVLNLVRPHSFSGPHHCYENYMQPCIRKPFIRYLYSGYFVPNSGILFTSTGSSDA